MAGVSQRIVFRLITLCRNVSFDVSEGHLVYNSGLYLLRWRLKFPLGDNQKEYLMGLFLVLKL